MNATGTNTDSKTSVMAMIGAVIFAIARLVASAGVSSGCSSIYASTALDDDDRIVDDDADRKHERQQRDGVGRIADRVQNDEGADQADRHGDGRDQRRAQAAEEEEDDQDDEDEGFDQRLLAPLGW